MVSRTERRYGWSAVVQPFIGGVRIATPPSSPGMMLVYPYNICPLCARLTRRQNFRKDLEARHPRAHPGYSPGTRGRCRSASQLLAFRRCDSHARRAAWAARRDTTFFFLIVRRLMPALVARERAKPARIARLSDAKASVISTVAGLVEFPGSSGPGIAVQELIVAPAACAWDSLLELLGALHCPSCSCTPSIEIASDRAAAVRDSALASTSYDLARDWSVCKPMGLRRQAETRALHTNVEEIEFGFCSYGPPSACALADSDSAPARSVGTKWTRCQRDGIAGRAFSSICHAAPRSNISHAAVERRYTVRHSRFESRRQRAERAGDDARGGYVQSRSRRTRHRRGLFFLHTSVRARRSR